MRRVCFVAVLLFDVFLISFAQSDVGDACTRSHDHRAGTCKRASDCPEANRLLQLAGIKPDKCGDDITEPIVCCVPRPPRPSRKPSNHQQHPQPLGAGDDDSINKRVSTKRISEQKCDEYSSQVKKRVDALLLLTQGETISFDVAKCDYQSVELIVGGEEAKQGEFPHMALIGWSSNNGTQWMCGGSLISDDYILTAAHCTSVGSDAPDMIRLGEQNIKRDDDGASPVDIPIAEIIRHPQYRWPSKYNDIALMRLQRKAPLDNFIRPACLYTRDTFNVTKTIATGWGRIEYASAPSDDLLKVSLNIIDNSICAPLYVEQQDRKLRNGIVDTQMCAGDLKGKKDACQGDSGGPIQISSASNKCIFYIIGVTSFGKGCGGVNSPGVYTRVSKYVTWIESIVWPNAQQPQRVN